MLLIKTILSVTIQQSIFSHLAYKVGGKASFSVFRKLLVISFLNCRITLTGAAVAFLLLLA